MTHDSYTKLIGNYPNLTSQGFGVNMDYSEGHTHDELFALRRKELEDAYEQFVLCVTWLHTNTISGNWNAQYWKDQVQDAYKPENPGYFYIPRGVFVLAALHNGLKVERMEDSTDAWISCGERIS